MQRALYILIGLVMLIGIGIGIFYVVTSRQSPSGGQPTTNANPYPNIDTNNSTTVTSQPSSSKTATSTASASTMRIPLSNGKTMRVKDFIHNGETVADAVNPGYYILAGSLGYCLANGSCPSGYHADDFTVSYNLATGFFTVTLYEPLGASRAAAEIFLADRLGVSAAQLCVINYWVGVPVDVNGIYSGKNLGFDFCPGSTPLQ